MLTKKSMVQIQLRTINESINLKEVCIYVCIYIYNIYFWILNTHRLINQQVEESEAPVFTEVLRNYCGECIMCKGSVKKT